MIRALRKFLRSLSAEDLLRDQLEQDSKNLKMLTGNRDRLRVVYEASREEHDHGINMLNARIARIQRELQAITPKKETAQ